MCFVLDINSFHLLFGRDPDFVPLSDWLWDCPGTCLVYGGTHYREELEKLHKYLPRITELKRARKLSEISDEVVDDQEKRVKQAVQQQDFDDPHIVAIFCASGCLIFASHDKRADTFIKMTCLYPKHQSPPSIYRSAKHKNLLCKDKIVTLKHAKG